MILAALCACPLSAGLLLIYRAMAPARPPLVEQLATLTGEAHTAGQQRPADGGLADKIEDWAAPVADRWPALAADLALADHRLGRHVLATMGTGALFATLAGGLVVFFAALGLGLPAGLGVIGVALAGSGGAAGPTLAVRSQARERRVSLRGLLPGYLDLTQVKLAAGQSVEAATRSAAAAGDGWGYQSLRHALGRAARSRRPAGDALADLGRETGVDELVEIAETLSAAAGAGTAVRASLAARAASLREHALRDAEASAGKASEGMAFPMVALVAGFLLLIGYPALNGIAAGLG
jgi:Flp pilus assembly protein TadB